MTSAGAAMGFQDRADDAVAELDALVRNPQRNVVRITTGTTPPVEIVVNVAGESHAAERLGAITVAALRLLDQWFGPYPAPRLTVVEVPWSSVHAGASYPGLVATRQRRLAPARDVTAERFLIAASTRQYWQHSRRAADPSFVEGVVLYSATRAIHELLGGRNFPTQPAFGGFVSYPIRAIQLSPSQPQLAPRLRSFDEVNRRRGAPWRAASAEHGGAAQRVALGAAYPRTTCRLAGGAAGAGRTLAIRRSAIGAEALEQSFARSTASICRGSSASRWRRDADIDYAIEQLSTTSSAEQPGVYETVVTARRVGGTPIAGMSRPRDQLSPQAVPLSVKFSDGSEILEHWDGRDASVQFDYDSRSPAVSASIDPMLVLLLDDNRENNSKRLTAPANHPTGVRLALHWFIWLQDLMLSSLSLVS